MVREEIMKILEHNKEQAGIADGAEFLELIGTDIHDPHKDTLDIIAARIANDGDLMVPLGISDIAAHAFGRYANRSFTGRRPWGDGVQEVFEYE